MKILPILFLIMALSPMSKAVEDISLIELQKIDPDTLTASQNHKIMAAFKADALDRYWEKSAVQRASFYDQSEYDVLYYKIDITIDMENEYVDSAIVTITAKSLIDGLSIIELDFFDSLPDPYYPTSVNLSVDSIYTENERLEFDHIDNKLLVELGNIYNADESFTISIRYHGSPYRDFGQGLIISQRQVGTTSTILKPIAYTFCEPYGSRLWWPCKDRPDDKADSVDIFVTIPEEYFCASNGQLIGVAPCQGFPSRHTFHYKVAYPIVTYLVAFSVSDFTIWSDWFYYGTNDSMEVINHMYPEIYEDSYESLQKTPEMIEIFSDLYCLYPFLDEKYGHMNWMGGGAMEHQTCTSAPPNSWGYSAPIVSHELAHQWWGDMITCKSWHDIWLNEGFASYSEALYYEAKLGNNAYREYMNSMEYKNNRSVYIYDTTYASNIFNIVVYDKGAWVLHMLRGIVGDEAFFDFLHTYADSQYKYKSITTEQFIDLCNSFFNMNLNEFFNDWLYDIMFPVYTQLYYIEPDLSDGKYWISYHLLQTQTYGPDVFEMPVELRFFSDDEVFLDTTIFNDAQNHFIPFKVSVIPDSIVVDPEDWILNDDFTMIWNYGLLQLPLDPASQYCEYLDTVLCRGGSGHNDFQIIDGNLPSGLSLGSESGIISGSPGESGDFSFTVQVIDTHSSYNQEAEYSLTVTEGVGWPGDANRDEGVDILDVVFMINYKYKNGPTPTIPILADPNADCAIDILDAVYLINYKYKSGAKPELGCVVL